MWRCGAPATLIYVLRTVYVHCSRYTFNLGCGFVFAFVYARSLLPGASGCQQLAPNESSRTPCLCTVLNEATRAFCPCSPEPVKSKHARAAQMARLVMRPDMTEGIMIECKKRLVGTKGCLEKHPVCTFSNHTRRLERRTFCSNKVSSLPFQPHLQPVLYEAQSTLRYDV